MATAAERRSDARRSALDVVFGRGVEAELRRRLVEVAWPPFRVRLEAPRWDVGLQRDAGMLVATGNLQLKLTWRDGADEVGLVELALSPKQAWIKAAEFVEAYRRRGMMTRTFELLVPFLRELGA